MHQRHITVKAAPTVTYPRPLAAFTGLTLP